MSNKDAFTGTIKTKKILNSKETLKIDPTQQHDHQKRQQIPVPHPPANHPSSPHNLKKQNSSRFAQTNGNKNQKNLDKKTKNNKPLQRSTSTSNPELFPIQSSKTKLRQSESFLRKFSEPIKLHSSEENKNVKKETEDKKNKKDYKRLMKEQSEWKGAGGLEGLKNLVKLLDQVEQARIDNLQWRKKGTSRKLDSRFLNAKNHANLLQYSLYLNELSESKKSFETTVSKEGRKRMLHSKWEQVKRAFTSAKHDLVLKKEFAENSIKSAQSYKSKILKSSKNESKYFKSKNKKQIEESLNAEEISKTETATKDESPHSIKSEPSEEKSIFEFSLSKPLASMSSEESPLIDTKQNPATFLEFSNHDSFVESTAKLEDILNFQKQQAVYFEFPDIVPISDVLSHNSIISSDSTKTNAHSLKTSFSLTDSSQRQTKNTQNILDSNESNSKNKHAKNTWEKMKEIIHSRRGSIKNKKMKNNQNFSENTSVEIKISNEKSLYAHKKQEFKSTPEIFRRKSFPVENMENFDESQKAKNSSFNVKKNSNKRLKKPFRHTISFDLGSLNEDLKITQMNIAKTKQTILKNHRSEEGKDRKGDQTSSNLADEKKIFEKVCEPLGAPTAQKKTVKKKAKLAAKTVQNNFNYKFNFSTLEINKMLEGFMKLSKKSRSTPCLNDARSKQGSEIVLIESFLASLKSSSKIYGNLMDFKVSEKILDKQHEKLEKNQNLLKENYVENGKRVNKSSINNVNRKIKTTCQEKTSKREVFLNRSFSDFSKEMRNYFELIINKNPSFKAYNKNYIFEHFNKKITSKNKDPAKNSCELKENFNKKEESYAVSEPYKQTVSSQSDDQSVEKPVQMNEEVTNVKQPQHEITHKLTKSQNADEFKLNTKLTKQPLTIQNSIKLSTTPSVSSKSSSTSEKQHVLSRLMNTTLPQISKFPSGVVMPSNVTPISQQSKQDHSWYEEVDEVNFEDDIIEEKQQERCEVDQQLYVSQMHVRLKSAPLEKTSTEAHLPPQVLSETISSNAVDLLEKQTVIKPMLSLNPTTSSPSTPQTLSPTGSSLKERLLSSPKYFREKMKNIKEQKSSSSVKEKTPQKELAAQKSTSTIKHNFFSRCFEDQSFGGS